MTAPDNAPGPAELEALRSRITALEALARDLLSAYRPYPHEGSGFWRAVMPVSDGQMAQWRAVLDGEEW